MPAHDPARCRDQLALLMAEQNVHLAALESLLVHEYTLLQSRDAEGLEQAGTARQHCVGHILRIEDERSALCRATGRGEDPSGLQGLLAWCDPAGSLVAAMREYVERTRRCREQNDRNGQLVNARLQQESRAYGAGSVESGSGRQFSTRA